MGEIATYLSTHNAGRVCRRRRQRHKQKRGGQIVQAILRDVPLGAEHLHVVQWQSTRMVIELIYRLSM
jgi:hypothetical protein